jgi:hypothetical protein
VTQEDIQEANEATTVRITEITQQYARKGKAQVPPSFPRGEVPAAQVRKTPPPLLPIPILARSEAPCFSLENELSKIRIPFPLKEIMRMPTHKELIDRFLGIKSEVNLAEECPQVFLGLSKANNNPTPFYCSLLVNGLILRNYMLDSGASNNIITLKAMHELGLQITKLCRNVQAIDAREVPCCGVIKDLQVCLKVAPKRTLVMDVLVIDCLTQWGMLLSRQWSVDVGGSMQMDLSYANIPISQVEKVRIFREPKMLHYVEDLCARDNDYLYPDIKDQEAQETDLGMYMLSEIPETPMPLIPENELEHSQVWSMTFDGARSRQGSGARVVITAPSGMIFPFSSRLEFDCTNNMAEYEALLLGLRKARKMVSNY